MNAPNACRDQTALARPVRFRNGRRERPCNRRRTLHDIPKRGVRHGKGAGGSFQPGRDLKFIRGRAAGRGENSREYLAG